MKKTLMIALSLTLFGSVTLADDGDQGSGGNQGCTINCPPPCTVDCPPIVNGMGDEEITDSIASGDVFDAVNGAVDVVESFLVF